MSLWFHPLQIVQFFKPVDFSPFGTGCVLLQMNENKKLIVFPYNSRICTTNRQELCTTYRELLGIVVSLKTNEEIIFGSDHSAKVSNDHKPILTVIPIERILSQNFWFAQMQVTKFQKPWFYLY